MPCDQSVCDDVIIDIRCRRRLKPSAMFKINAAGQLINRIIVTDQRPMD